MVKTAVKRLKPTQPKNFLPFSLHPLRDRNMTKDSPLLLLVTDSSLSEEYESSFIYGIADRHEGQV